MKKLILPLLLIFLASIVFASKETSFRFVKKREYKNEVEVYFKLISPLDEMVLKNKILEIEKVKSFGIVDQSSSYYKLMLSDESQNSQIRDVILGLGSDIHQDYIIITSKTYYEKEINN